MQYSVCVCVLCIVCVALAAIMMEVSKNNYEKMLFLFFIIAVVADARLVFTTVTLGIERHSGSCLGSTRPRSPSWHGSRGRRGWAGALQVALCRLYANI